MNIWERCFKLHENGTTFRREVYTGLVSFLAVSYILAVNPDILAGAGMDRGGVFFATALAAFVGTLCMAFWANCPLVLAPAMGLNAFFAYTVVNSMGYSWQLALFAIAVEGVVFFLLSASSVREKVVNAIPMPLKYAMGAGIGLFITLIAFQNAHIIQSDPVTFLTVQDFFGPAFHTAGISGLLALAGVLITTWLLHRKVMGALLLGILGTWLLGILCQLVGVYQVSPETGFYSLLPQFKLQSFTEPFERFRQLFASAFDAARWTREGAGVSGWHLLFSVDFAIICLAFLFNDFFDTIGTVNGVFVNTPMMRKDGKIPQLKKILLADSAATFAGAVLGTSTTTTYAESAVGIGAGAKTGLSALTAALLFLVSLICAPVFLAIPGFATAPALILVGFMMVKAIAHIEWDHITEAIPAYILIAGMVFTYSISDGLGLGIIFYTLLNCRAKGRVSWLLWLLSLVFVMKYIWL